MYTISADEWKYLAGDVSEDVRVDYSGRGMYGRTCVGFTGNVSDLVDFVTNITEQWVEADYPSEGDLATVYRKLSDVQTDSMGWDTIFYWPGLTVKEEED